jgi:hypothetical protein
MRQIRITGRLAHKKLHSGSLKNPRDMWRQVEANGVTPDLKIQAQVILVDRLMDHIGRVDRAMAAAYRSRTLTD